MFGRRNIRRAYASSIREIEAGKRRDPQHDNPVSLRAGRQVGEIDEIVFRDFAWLGVAMDRRTSDSWSFEQTSDTMLRASHLDGPAYGRRWIIYYNSIRLGWLEVSASPEELFESAENFQINPFVQVDLVLHLARFIISSEIFNILYHLALFIGDDHVDQSRKEEQATLRADSAMVRYMWEVMHAGDEYVPDLEFSMRGSHSEFRKTTEYWKMTGFDPFSIRRSRSQAPIVKY